MRKLCFIALVLFFALCLTWIVGASEGNGQPSDIGKGLEAEIPGEMSRTDGLALRNRVGEFGQQLKKVSLLGPDDALKQSIRRHYGEYVTRELLAEWLANPRSAPGRLVSSPWPDHINISSIVMNCTGGQTKAEVRADIVEITSVENVNGNVAAKHPLMLTLVKVGGRWLIDGITMGGP